MGIKLSQGLKQAELTLDRDTNNMDNLVGRWGWARHCPFKTDLGSKKNQKGKGRERKEKKDWHQDQ